MVGESSTVADLIASGDIEFIQDGNHGGNYPKSTEFVDSGIPLITGACLEDGRVNLNKASFLKQDRAESLRVGFAKTGDVLLSHKGTMGKTAIVPEIESPYIILNPQLTLYRINPNGRLKAQFLRYFFDSAFFQSHIVNISATSTINTLPVFEQKRLLIPIPEIQLQEQIIRHVGSLDDKIELNRRINETLEGMAQALFKSWFVDFDPVIDNALAAGNPIPEPLAQRAETRRQALANGTANRESAQAFPASFRFTEELGYIPEGWEEQAVKDFGNVICGKTPSKTKAEFYGKDIPFIKIPDMHSSVWITQTSDGLSKVGAASQSKKQIPANSICVSCIATVGKVVITSEESHTNQQINSVVPHDTMFRDYLYFTFSSINKELHDLASGGSATLNLNTGNFSKINLLKPSVHCLEKFSHTTANLFQKILCSDKESQTLAKLRDVLLPKLISGELRIPQAEKMVEEAVA